MLRKRCYQLSSVIFCICSFCFSFSLVAQPLTGTWAGTIEKNGKHWAVEASFEQKGKDYQAYLDFVDAGGYRRLFTVAYNHPAVRLERGQPGGSKIVFDCKISGEKMTGKWSGIGIEDAQFSLQRVRKTTSALKETSFRNDTVTLYGHLVLPAGKGPFPAVIITHGGAAQDRWDWYGIARHFQDNGIAALVYDKRGVGKSAPGNWRNDGLHTLANDALAGVKMLRAHPQIDSSRIGVFGHSEGAWVAPLSAALSHYVKFVIASAPSSQNGANQTVFHLTNTMREAGYGESDINEATQVRRLWQKADSLCWRKSATSANAYEQFAAALEKIKDKPWLEAAALGYPFERRTCGADGLMHLLFFDPLKEIWPHVKVPVFLGWGEKDNVVPVGEGQVLIPKTLKENGNRNVKVYIQSNMAHNVALLPSDSWDFPRLPAAYFNEMVRWIKALR